MRLFGGSEGRVATQEFSRERIARPSSGWSHMLQTIGSRESQRTLDVGPTSSTNIQLLTQYGHSIYTVDLIAESHDPRWQRAEPDAPFPAREFVNDTLAFHGRPIDTVFFWDAADYLPAEVLEEAVACVYDAMAPGGQLLALFHTKPDDVLNRYHLRDDGQVDVQFVSERPTLHIYSNRQVENIFAAFSTYRFFLAKDNLREVVVTR